MSQTSESNMDRCAGMFRTLRNFPGDYPKKSGEYLCKVSGKYVTREWNGCAWMCEDNIDEWLDDSEEAIAEARQESLISEMEAVTKQDRRMIFDLQNADIDMAKQIDRLTADLALVKERLSKYEKD